MIVSVENPKESGSGDLPLMNTSMYQKVCTLTLWGQKLLCLGSAQTPPCGPLHRAVQACPLSFPLINWETSLVLLHTDTDYYPFHMYPDESANVNFNAKRATPLRRIMIHPHPHGLHTQAFL